MNVLDLLAVGFSNAATVHGLIAIAIGVFIGQVVGLLPGIGPAAGMALLDEGETTCCYARSEKHWVTDPQGIAWEAFHTLANIPVFNEREAVRTAAPAT